MAQNGPFLGHFGGFEPSGLISGENWGPLREGSSFFENFRNSFSSLEKRGPEGSVFENFSKNFRKFLGIEISTPKS